MRLASFCDWHRQRGAMPASMNSIITVTMETPRSIKLIKDHTVTSRQLLDAKVGDSAVGQVACSEAGLLYINREPKAAAPSPIGLCARQVGESIAMPC